MHNRDMGGGEGRGGYGEHACAMGWEGWLVACRGQRQVKVTEKEGTNKMEGEKKKRRSGKKEG